MNQKTLTVGRIASWMDANYPPQLQEDWDKVGLICGERADAVTKVLLAVDPTEAVVDEALEWGAEMVITHHPLFLRGTSFVSTDTAKGRVVHRLIRAQSALFNAHTNADAAAGGVAEALARAVGLSPDTWKPLEPSSGHLELGIGRIGSLVEDSVTVGTLAKRLAAALPSSPAGVLVGGDLNRRVTRVAVSGGSGQSLLETARNAGADAFVTADLRHHPATDYLEQESADGQPAPALLVPSHWASEWLWLPDLKKQLEAAATQSWAGCPLEVRVSKVVSEPWETFVSTADVA